jgi:predicted acyltransferase (DUF342 family)
MSQILRKWISDAAIDHTKLDSSDSFLVRDMTTSLDLHVNGDATVLGNLSLAHGLTVDSLNTVYDMTAGRNLRVLGDSTTVNLGVSGNSTVLGNSYVTGIQTVNQDLRVNRDATVSGNLSLGTVSNLNVTYDATVGRNLRVLGDATIGQNLRVSGDSSVEKLIISGDSTVQGILRVLDDIRVADDASVAGTAYCFDASVQRHIHIPDSTTTNPLGHAGLTMGSGSNPELILMCDPSGNYTTLWSSLPVTVQSSTSLQLSAGTVLSLNGTYVSAGEDLQVGRDATIGGNLKASSFSDSTINGDLKVTGKALFSDDATFSGSSKNVVINGYLTVNSNVDLEGDAYCAGTMEIYDMSSTRLEVGTDATVGGNLKVMGDASGFERLSDEGLITLTFSSSYFSVDQTPTCYYKVSDPSDSSSPRIVTLALPEMLGILNGQHTVIPATGAPFASIAPKTDTVTSVLGKEENEEPINLRILSDGVFTMKPSSGGDWTSSPAGFYASVIQYPIWP